MAFAMEEMWYHQDHKKWPLYRDGRYREVVVSGGSTLVTTDTLGCQQSLICSKICVIGRDEYNKVVSSECVAACLCPCALSFLFLPTDFREKGRLLAVY